jgi:hypothetical protein
MKIENIQQLFGLGTELLKDNVATLCAVLMKPRAFFAGVSVDTPADVLRASVFAGFISILNLVISTPLLRVAGVEMESTSFLLTDTVLTYAAWFLYGSIFHISAKVLRGQGSYSSSVVAFLYLTAFYPVMGFLGLPAAHVVARPFLQAQDTLNLEFYRDLGPAFVASPAALISFGLASVVGLYFFFALILAARRVHGFGRARGISAGALAFVGYLIISVSVVVPVEQLFRKAFLK